jgi:vacuolar-type H+-ATPase subunit I/STV1
LVFLLTPLLLYRRIVAAAGKAKVHLTIVVGATTLIWGVMSATYFGVTPETIAKAGGYVKGSGGQETGDVDAMRSGGGTWASVGKAMMAVAPLWDADPERLRTILIKVSFVIGCIHLTLARLRRGLALAPDPRALAQVGWALFLWAMLGLIWMLFFTSRPVSMSIIQGGLIAGGTLVVLFTAPSRNPLKGVGIGVAASLLPALGTFSDTMSYVRLMAVGLATSYIGAAFNDLGATVADFATWFAAVPIILLGHALNIGLSIIAIFAHGVRLNMLEFSSNAGVQWAGYPYTAFPKTQIKET